MKPHPHWSSGSCERLTELSLGSLCGAKMGLLALLIRYTVADRLDDRREVTLDNYRTSYQSRLTGLARSSSNWCAKCQGGSTNVPRNTHIPFSGKAL